MGPDARAGEFGKALERLRGSGRALLVVGAVPDRIHRRAGTELLGDGERLFVRTSSVSAAGGRPTDADRVVEVDAAPRGGAATASADGTTGTLTGGFEDTNVTTVSTLAAAGDAVEDALSALDAPAGPQVCVDAVLPLIEVAGEERAFRFLHLVTGRVRQLGGTCHLHLSLPADGETAVTFGALADATIELRLVDDHPEQRWQVHDEGIRSDWLPLPSE